MKVCKKCGELKPLSDFYNRSDTNNTKSFCKLCDSVAAKQRYKNNRLSIKKTQQAYYNNKRNLINGNWELYFKNKVGVGRKKYNLTVQDCLDILEQQNGLCAVSGQSLTCIVGDYREHPPTNASLDRIQHGGEYTKSNVRLVCAMVNYMRLNQTDKELYDWCCAIKENLDAIYAKRQERLPS